MTSDDRIANLEGLVAELTQRLAKLEERAKADEEVELNGDRPVRSRCRICERPLKSSQHSIGIDVSAALASRDLEYPSVNRICETCGRAWIEMTKDAPRGSLHVQGLALIPTIRAFLSELPHMKKRAPPTPAASPTEPEPRSEEG